MPGGLEYLGRSGCPAPGRLVYLLRFFELIALFGLFVQAFLAWIFVAVLRSIRLKPTPQAFHSFFWAFTSLAVGLTLMSYRFAQVHGVGGQRNVLWVDGQLRPMLCYALYMGLKATFAALLVRGGYELAGRREPALVRRLYLPVIVLMAAAPLLSPGIDGLLAIQAPVMICAALAALAVIRPLRIRDSGSHIVYWSLIGMALSWGFHAAIVTADYWFDMLVPLSLNSFLDLAVQLTLGIGLLVSMFESNHRRWVEAEEERERLRRSLEKDEKLRALGTVVSGVAHELNNPLTVIVGYAAALRKHAMHEQQARIIGEQAERCRVIVRSLSALAGQSVHPRETIEFSQLAGHVVRGLGQELLEDRSINVEAPSSLSFRADRVGIEHVLRNLVKNALQASPLGGVVTLGARPLDDGVELFVEDEGPGVPVSERERLFEPFYTTRSPGKGTGLGLSMAHSIVRAHHGMISVGEREGVSGASFRVRIPGHAEDAGRDTLHSVPKPRDPRLLVVDDDKAVRTVLRSHAENRGWQVTEAGSAEEALQEPLHEVGAILCDLRMPGMGGIGFHDELHERDAVLLEKVVFATGDYSSEDTVHFESRCDRPLVHKPFNFDHLFRCLGAVANKAGHGNNSDPARSAKRGRHRGQRKGLPS